MFGKGSKSKATQRNTPKRLTFFDKVTFVSQNLNRLADSNLAAILCPNPFYAKSKTEIHQGRLCAKGKNAAYFTNFPETHFNEETYYRISDLAQKVVDSPNQNKNEINRLYKVLSKWKLSGFSFIF